MFCTKCGHLIADDDRFCTQCGTPVTQERVCPGCGAKAAEDAIFCGKCGTLIGEPKNAPVSQPAPAAQPVFTAATAAQQVNHENAEAQPINNAGSAEQPVFTAQQTSYDGNPGTQANPQGNPGGDNFFGSSQLPQPKKYQMISQYEGEPNVGIARATGTLMVYSDRLEFTKVMGNSLTSMFGAVGMIAAANTAKKDDGKTEIYRMQDIREAHVGKYGAVMPTVVLSLRDGRVFSFAGSFTTQSASSIVNTIWQNQANH